MPFQCPRCVIDTNVLSDFYECGCLPLIWQLFPGGVWIDPYVCEELKVKYQLDVQHALAHLQQATCLSADNAVYKTCQERGIKVSRHGGILEEAVKRNMISKTQALRFFQAFLDRGLTMKPSVREALLKKFS